MVRFDDTQVTESILIAPYQLNIPKFIPEYESVPQSDFIKQFHDEIAPFHRQIYENVIRKLMVLFAIILELPEDYFVERHAYERPSEDHMRYVRVDMTSVVTLI